MKRLVLPLICLFFIQAADACNKIPNTPDQKMMDRLNGEYRCVPADDAYDLKRAFDSRNYSLPNLKIQFLNSPMAKALQVEMKVADSYFGILSVDFPMYFYERSVRSPEIPTDPDKIGDFIMDKFDSLSADTQSKSTASNGFESIKFVKEHEKMECYLNAYNLKEFYIQSFANVPSDFALTVERSDIYSIRPIENNEKEIRLSKVIYQSYSYDPRNPLATEETDFKTVFRADLKCEKIN